MIRPATPQDAPALGAIWNAVIRHSTAIFSSEERSEEEIAQLTAQNFWVWDDGALQGFVRFFPFRAGNGYLHTVEHTIMLAPSAQGKGIGRQLVEHAAGQAKAQQKHTLWGAVTGENASGIAFHRACGFTEHGRLPEVGYKFGRWHDVVLMGRRL